MAIGNFERCIEFIKHHEGVPGKSYVDHPKDPGGATNWGITQGTLEEWRHRSVTKEEVRNLTWDEAKEIYKARYWDPLGAEKLPAGVDLSVLDMGINAGRGTATRLLQRVLRVAEDGTIGPVTLNALAKASPGQVVRDYSTRRHHYYKSLRHWPTFGNAWTRRRKETELEALKMVNTAPVAKPPPLPPLPAPVDPPPKPVWWNPLTWWT